MYSVICVFYCIYSDVQRSIREGNNPKVKMVSVVFIVHGPCNMEETLVSFSH